MHRSSNVVALSLAAVLALSACATREKQAEELSVQPLAASALVPESPRIAAHTWGGTQEARQSPGGSQAGRTAAGALGGALVGALAPVVILGAGGPIGIAVGLYLAPAGAAVGAAVGAARSASSR